MTFSGFSDTKGYSTDIAKCLGTSRQGRDFLFDMRLSGLGMTINGIINQSKIQLFSD